MFENYFQLALCVTGGVYDVLVNVNLSLKLIAIITIITIIMPLTNHANHGCFGHIA